MTTTDNTTTTNNRIIKPILKSKSSTTETTNLQMIKQKFITAKEELVLPWQQYASSSCLPQQSPPPQQQQQQQISSSSSSNNDNYTNLMQEITNSHVLLAATHFETMSFDEADKIQKKFIQLKEVLCSLYERIRVHIDTARATMMTLKLDYSSPHCSNSSNRRNDFYQSIENTVQIDQLLEEFYFTSKYANHLESKYLQHIAGTLSLLYSDNDSKCSSSRSTNNDCVQEVYDNILISILNRLKDTIHYNSNDSSKEEVEEENDRQLIADPSSPSSCSILSTCSSSSFASSTTTANKIFSSNASTCTIITAPSSNTPLANTATVLIQQQIDAIIDKLSRQLKQKDQVIRLFEIQTRHLETQEQLAKQRERSANLVLELEKSKLLLNSKKEQELKDQLTQETLKNQLLQDQVSSFEYALKTKDKMIENSSLEIEILRSRLREKTKLDENYQWQFMMQQLTPLSSFVDTKDGNDVKTIIQQLTRKYNEQDAKIAQLQDEKKSWLDTKQSILNQCSIITDISVKEEESIEDIFTQLSSLISEEKAKQQKQNEKEKNYTDLWTLKEQHNDDNFRLKSKQAEIFQLQEAIKTFTMRESAYILQSASTEAELERILKEYDRLTRNIIDFNMERKKYESEISFLNQQKAALERKLSDQQICLLDGGSTLRKEFRDLMMTVKEQHEKEMVKELEARRKLEQKLREKMGEIEMKRWEKVDVAVQTSFLIL